MKKTLFSFLLFLTTISYGQVTIGSGTNVDSNAGLCTPISNFYSTSLSQFIYSASEINAQAGSITGLKFYLNSTTALTNSDGMIDIWIGHTTRTSYSPVVSTTGADWIPVSSQTQVLTNGSLIQAGNIVSITLDTPFVFNGNDNLVITVDANEPADDGISVLYYQTAPSANFVSLMYRTDNALQNPVPASPPLNYTGTVVATSTQAKYTRPIISLEGLTTLGTAEISADNLVTLFPNPVEDNLFLNTIDKINGAIIYDIKGQIVDTINNLDSTIISTSKLASGVYILKMNIEGGEVRYRKFIKK